MVVSSVRSNPHMHLTCDAHTHKSRDRHRIRKTNGQHAIVLCVLSVYSQRLDYSRPKRKSRERKNKTKKRIPLRQSEARLPSSAWSPTPTATPPRPPATMTENAFQTTAPRPTAHAIVLTFEKKKKGKSRSKIRRDKKKKSCFVVFETNVNLVQTLTPSAFFLYY